ncbi:MAG: putative toxin-antitoxin system toxin component, PIN family [Proteobacteria bacterium]|nr:putative toxin-antitoxin system toxin component, PIN family [Pseudomonadota bacterium]
MTRIVLDTNIFISAILSPRSKPASIVKLVLDGKLNLMIAPAMWKELHTVLQYPKLQALMKRNGVSMDEVKDLIHKIERIAIVTPGNTKVNRIKDDMSDNMFLACAVEARADFIISGDSHLKDVKTFKGVRIVSPDVFMQMVNKE